MSASPAATALRSFQTTWTMRVNRRRSRAAESAAAGGAGGRGIEPGVAGFGVGIGEGREEALQRSEIVRGGGGEGGFDGVVAGNDGGVVGVHAAGDLGGGLGLAREAGSPALVPGSEGGVAGSGGGVELAKGAGVVGASLVQEGEEVLGQRGVVGLVGEEAEFAAQGGEPVAAEALVKGVDGFLGEGEGGFGIGVQNGEQGFGEAGEIPRGDGGLLAEGVATVAVDGAEDGGGVVAVDEGARAVINGLAGERHVVGIHHAVDEADAHPLGDERGLALDGFHQKRGDRLLGLRALGEVSAQGVIGEEAQGGGIAEGGEILEGADADVAGATRVWKTAGRRA